MKTAFRIALVLTPVLILSTWVWIQSHSPQLRGELSLFGIEKNVDVYFDDFGVPHIYGRNAADTYHAFGYIHAQDRLFQMEVMRRVGKGRLAEIFGEDLIEADILFRTIGTHRKAAEDAARFDSLPAELQLICNSYIGGINEYLEEGKLPIEFTLAGIEAEPFTIEDIYAISGYMAYSFAFSLRTDPLVQKIRNTLSTEYMADFDLAWDDNAVDVVAVDGTAQAALSPIYPKALDELAVPMFQGSNNWMLSSSKTLSGKVLFANDTHIKYSSPSVFYEAHLEYPGFGIYGHYLAGIPIALIGHTRNHAWGLTMLENDDSDFFAEKFISNDSKYTLYNDSLRKEVIFHHDTIHTKGGKDSILTVLETIHGPIVNHILPEKFNNPVSMSWTYLELENNLLEAFWMINGASNMKKFEEGVAMINAPGLNVGYGDASGNIAWWGAAKLPIRKPENSGKQFLSGWNGQDEYLGYYDFTQNPAQQNPEVGYLVTANNTRAVDTLNVYPGYYAPQTRYDRLTSLLTNMRAATMDSMATLSLDMVSITEAKVAHEIAAAIRSTDESLSELEANALELLANWDGSHRLRDQEPTLYYLVLFHILERTFSDEMGDELFEMLLHTHMIQRSYPKLFMNPASPWWDDTTTPLFKERRRDLFAEALKESVAELEAQFGSEIAEWRWSKVHTTLHPHPMGKVKFLENFFNVGPFPSPGGNETVNNAGFTFNPEAKNEANFGPAMRIIIDFADVEHAITILPTGNSGNFLSPHFSDQAEMYIDGEFRAMMMNEKEIKALPNYLLIKSVE